MNGCDALPSLDNAPTQPAEKNEGYHKALKEVQSDIGSLMWISLRTRPDVQACVSMLACLSTVDPEYVLKCLKKVWRYLCGTFWLRVKYTGRCEKIITTASDASFAPQGSRSRTGITLFVGEDFDCMEVGETRTCGRKSGDSKLRRSRASRGCSNQGSPENSLQRNETKDAVDMTL